jgi:nitroreductase
MRQIRPLAVLTTFLALLVSCSPKETPKADTVLENILSRKSVRAYTDQKLTQEQIETMLKAGMAAPSGSDIRPWSFVVLQDPSKYEAIFGEANFNLRMYNASAAVLVVCADTTVTRTPRDGGDPVTMPNGTWRDDMGAVTENILLAAESMGLGACWTACYPYKARYMPVKDALHLPATVVPYCVIPVGVPDGEQQVKDKWDPTRIHYEIW